MSSVHYKTEENFSWLQYFVKFVKKIINLSFEWSSVFIQIIYRLSTIIYIIFIDYLQINYRFHCIKIVLTICRLSTDCFQVLHNRKSIILALKSIHFWLKKNEIYPYRIYYVPKMAVDKSNLLICRFFSTSYRFNQFLSFLSLRVIKFSNKAYQKSFTK